VTARASNASLLSDIAHLRDGEAENDVAAGHRFGRRAAKTKPGDPRR
jgi:hypothetical protein